MPAQVTPRFTADDLRLLDQEEAKLVETARRDDLHQIGQTELNDTLQRLRDRRNRARDLANRQRREARGKAEPSGVAPATGNVGTEGKAYVLGLALDLVTQERERRMGDGGSDERGSAAAPSQRELAERALELKQDGAEASAMLEDGSPLHPQDPEADPGKGAIPGKGAMAEKARNIAPSGALDHGGELPSRERSRTRY